MTMNTNVYILAVIDGRKRPTEARVVSVNEDGSIMVEPTSGKGHNTPWKKITGEYWMTEDEAGLEADRFYEQMAKHIDEIRNTPIGVDDLVQGLIDHASEITEPLSSSDPIKD